MTTQTGIARQLAGGSWRQSVARLADERRLWIGLSGSTLSGREVADHLAAAAAWLEQKGWGASSNRDIAIALARTAPGGVADLDTQMAGVWLLEMILQVATGSPRVVLLAWEGCPGRTHQEVRELLAVASEVARELGPRGVAA